MSKKIFLIGEHGHDKFALVDDSDYENVCKYRWHLNSGGYACRPTYISRKSKINPGKVGSISMHRQIIENKGGLIIDHINQNKLDNRRKNLRLCNYSQNFANRPKLVTNTSGFKGVKFDRKLNKYVARISYNYKNYYIGVYVKGEDAALAYNIKAKELYGDFVDKNKTPTNSTLVSEKMKNGFNISLNKNVSSKNGTIYDRKAENHLRSKPVIAYNLDGTLYKEYSCTVEAEKDGFNRKRISACCIGKIKTSNGKIWKRLNISSKEYLKSKI